MTRIETACFGLIASAFILAGLLSVPLFLTPPLAASAIARVAFLRERPRSAD